MATSLLLSFGATLSLPNLVCGDLHGVHDPSRAVFSIVERKWYVFSSHDGMRTSHTRNAYVTSGFVRGDAALGNIPEWARERVPGAGDEDFWAPDVVHAPNVNTWRMYYAVSSFGSQNSCIGLAEAGDPAGPWTDRGEVFCSEYGNPYNAIDPAPVIQTASRHWLTFGSFWNGIFILELDPGSGKAKQGADPIGPLARNPNSSTNSIEASYMHYENGYFYLFVNWGTCCHGTSSTYEIFVGRSKSVTGPFIDASGKNMADGGGLWFVKTHDSRALSQIASGHIGVLEHDNSEYITYHYYDANDGGAPALGLRPLWFDDNKWPVAGPPVSTIELLV